MNFIVSTPVLKSSFGGPESSGGVVSWTMSTCCHHLPVPNWLPAASYSPGLTIFMVVVVRLARSSSIDSWSPGVSVIFTSDCVYGARPIVSSCTPVPLESECVCATPPIRTLCGEKVPARSASFDLNSSTPTDRSRTGRCEVSSRGACPSARFM